MPISKVIYFYVLALVLAGCQGIALGSRPTESVSLADGAITISGPQGYCIDRRLSRLRGESFVVLGSCAALSRGAEGPAGIPGVLTATVSANATPALPSSEVLENFLRSPAGLAAVSRSSQAGTVEIQEAETSDGILFLTIHDSAPAREGAAVDPVYWRAIFELNGRLVTATVMSFTDRPLGPDAGRGLLSRFVAELKTTNTAS